LDQIDHVDRIFLVCKYYWPCVVTSVDETTGDVGLHYMGYDSYWDLVARKDQGSRLRPVQFPSEQKTGFEVGQDVEVRLLQKTNIHDQYAKEAYCWAMGKILSLDAQSALVKLILDSDRTGNQPLVVGESNIYTQKGSLIPGEKGFERVKVSLQAIKTLEQPYCMSG
jgi:hypothetical protein